MIKYKKTNRKSSLVLHKDAIIYKVVSVIVIVTDVINGVIYWTFLLVLVIVEVTAKLNSIGY